MRKTKNIKADNESGNKAEDRVRKKINSSKLLLPDDNLNDLVQKLQTQRVELELQNRELEMSKVRAESSVEKYNLLYEFAPMAYFTLDRNSAILEVNLAGSVLMNTNRSSLVNKNFRNFIEDRQGFDHYLENLFSGMTRESCEMTIISHNISLREV